MKIGCPTEIKPQEFRVGMTPNAAGEAVARGHQALVQKGAGLGAGFSDEDYTAAGAQIIDTAEEIEYVNNGGILHYVLRNLNRAA